MTEEERHLIGGGGKRPPPTYFVAMSMGHEDEKGGEEKEIGIDLTQSSVPSQSIYGHLHTSLAGKEFGTEQGESTEDKDKSWHNAKELTPSGHGRRVEDEKRGNRIDHNHQNYSKVMGPTNQSWWRGKRGRVGLSPSKNDQLK